jgi:hypothetical protein
MKQMPNNLRLLILLMILVAMAACGGAYPSDQKMVERLRSQNSDFSHLVEMFQQDTHLLSVDREFAHISYDTKANLPNERMEEYRQLFKKLDLINIRRYRNAEGIYLKAWHQDGFIIGGSYKHYVYAKTSPSPVVDSLDTLKHSGHDAYAYKRASDNWYLNLDIW